MIIDPANLYPQSCYKLLIGSVVPRLIAWTSTMSREGVRNLAPFSFFTVASRQPSAAMQMSCSTTAISGTWTFRPSLASLRRKP